MNAQGATEYLILLGVILIVALVVIALVGFFPDIIRETNETAIVNGQNQTDLSNNNLAHLLSIQQNSAYI